MDNQGTAETAKRPRHWGFLVPGVYVLAVGIIYHVVGFILNGIAIFQGVVVVSILLIVGVHLAFWWYSGSVPPQPEDPK